MVVIVQALLQSVVFSLIIDGVISSIDTTVQRGTWAYEVFVANGTGQDSIMIGFQLQSSSSYLRGIEIACAILLSPAWIFFISGIKVYSSSIFTDFFNIASTLHVTHNSLPIDICHSFPQPQL